MIWSISGECSKPPARKPRLVFLRFPETVLLRFRPSGFPFRLPGQPQCIFFLLVHLFLRFLQIQNSAADLSSPFCCGSFFFLSFSKLQVRYGIQVPAVAGSLLVLVVSCHTDHGRIVGTEDRGRTVKADALFSHAASIAARSAPFDATPPAIARRSI